MSSLAGETGRGGSAFLCARVMQDHVSLRFFKYFSACWVIFLHFSASWALDT